MADVRIETSPKRVRVMLGGVWVADGNPLLVWDSPYYPTYYFRTDDIATGVLAEVDSSSHHDDMGAGTNFDVSAGDAVAKDAATQYRAAPHASVADAVRFDWGAMDHWFEEDEEVHVHARSPYHRVDVLHSSRHIRIEIDGNVIADTHSPTLLFETGLPTRYYLPKADVRMDLLTPTELVTSCPYKGNASYWSYGDHRNIAWGYSFPTTESAKVAGLVCFYDEKVDVYIDDQLQERPVTHFG